MRKNIFCAAVLFFAVPGLSGAQEAPIHQELSERVEGHAKKTLAEHAEKSGWGSYRVEVTPWVPTLSDAVLRCDQTPSVERSNHTHRLWGRVSYEIECQQPSWKIRARADVDLALPVVKAARNLDKDDRITDDTLMIEETNASRVFGDFVTSKLELIGRQVDRRLRAGQVVSLDMTAAPFMVHENRRVLIRVNQGGIVASMPGLSLDDGAKGDAVRVKNPSSGKIITAWVIDRGVVQSNF